MIRDYIDYADLERYLLEEAESSGAGNSVMNEVRLAAKMAGNLYFDWCKLKKSHAEHLDEMNRLKNRCINLENRLEATEAALDEAKYHLAPDWERVPGWAKFYTRNKSGRWLAHETKPYEFRDGWKSDGMSKEIGFQEIVVDWHDAYFERAFVPNEGEFK